MKNSLYTQKINWTRRRLFAMENSKIKVSRSVKIFNKKILVVFSFYAVVGILFANMKSIWFLFFIGGITQHLKTAWCYGKQ